MVEHVAGSLCVAQADGHLVSMNVGERTTEHQRSGSIRLLVCSVRIEKYDVALAEVGEVGINSSTFGCVECKMNVFNLSLIVDDGVNA